MLHNTVRHLRFLEYCLTTHPVLLPHTLMDRQRQYFQLVDDSVAHHRRDTESATSKHVRVVRGDPVRMGLADPILRTTLPRRSPLTPLPPKLTCAITPWKPGSSAVAPASGVQRSAPSASALTFPYLSPHLTKPRSAATITKLFYSTR